MASSKARVRDVDNGWKALVKRITRMSGGIAVTVGIQGSKAAEQHGTDDGLTNVQLGTHHEFGAPNANIPQRSWLRSTFDENRKKYEKLMFDASKKSLDVLDPLAPFVIAGEIARGDVIKKIKAGIDPPLKAATIARKGSSTPLIDEGILINSITSEVRLGV